MLTDGAEGVSEDARFLVFHHFCLIQTKHKPVCDHFLPGNNYDRGNPDIAQIALNRPEKHPGGVIFRQTPVSCNWDYCQD